jgi:hypothetical protein
MSLVTLNFINSGLANTCSPAKPPESPSGKSEQDPSSIRPKKPPLELKSGPTSGSQPVVREISNDSTPSTGPALNLALNSPPANSESYEDTSSDSDTWSTSSVLTGDSIELSNPADSEVHSHHGKLHHSGQEGNTKQLAHSLGNETGVRKCAPRDDPINAGSKHSFSNSSSSSNSGLQKRSGSAGGPGGGRKIGSEDNDEDDGYGGDNSLQFYNGETPGPRKLACPYFKRNPDVYSGTKYRLCKYSGFATVHRLK